MNLNLRHRVFGGATAFAMALVLYGCHDFLTQNAVPQGAVTAGTLKTKSGVEGTLIAAYRALERDAASAPRCRSDTNRHLGG